MNRRLIVAQLVLFMAVVGTCVCAADTAIPQEEGANPWSHLEFKNDPDEFQFAIVADRTGGHRPGVFGEAVEKLNWLQPEFVMSIGDLIEGYTSDDAKLDAQWDEFEALPGKLEMPFFYVAGNHDITYEQDKPEMGKAMAADWQKRSGRTYYHFVYKDVLFLCLESQRGQWAELGDEQVEYIARTLAENEGVRWTLVFLHQPIWAMREEAELGEWLRVEALLKDRPYTVFSGHTHRYSKYERQGRDYYVLATTGGRSDLSGPAAGRFDHIVWVTMGPDGPKIANLALDGILPDDITSPERQALIAALQADAAAGVSPLVAGGPTLETASIEAAMANPADGTVVASGKFRPHPVLTVTPAEFQLTPAPGTVARQTIVVKAAEPTKVEDLPPLELQWNVTADFPLLPAVEKQYEQTVPVIEADDPPIALPRTQTPIVIDGNLEEWQDLPLERVAPKHFAPDPLPEDLYEGPEDISFRWAIRYDDEFIYIAVNATDDKPFDEPRRRFWKQDSVFIRLDARPDPMRSWSRSGGMRPPYLFNVFVPADGQKPMRRTGRLVKGTQAVSIRTETGHNLEMAIPLSYVTAKQGEDWEGLRVNIGVFDHDEPGDKGVVMRWRPKWAGPENYAGSGTFVRK